MTYLCFKHIIFICAIVYQGQVEPRPFKRSLVILYSIFISQKVLSDFFSLLPKWKTDAFLY